MAEKLFLKRKCSDKNWSDVYDWIMKEGWVGFYPELWGFVRNFADTTILIATNDRDETLGCLIFNHPPEWKFKNVMIYITHPDRRGKGIGKFIWKNMENILQKSPLMIQSVPPTTEMYRTRYGFVHTDPHTVLSTKIGTGKLKNATDKYLKQKSSPLNGMEDPRIVKFDKDVHMDLMLAYDFQISKRHRRSSVPQYLEMSVSNTVVAFAKDSDVILGLCCLTNHSSGKKFGPFYAENVCVALKLMHFLLHELNLQDSDLLTLNVPEANVEFYKFICALFEPGEDLGLRFYTSYTEPYKSVVGWARVYSPMSIQPDC